MHNSEAAAHRAALKLQLHMRDYLNKLVALDQGAMHLLIETRFPCNQAMVDDPHVKVATIPHPTDPSLFPPQPFVGLLGVINGFLSKEAGPAYLLVARDTDEGALINFALADGEDLADVSP